jgi:hypothetical protein
MLSGSVADMAMLGSDNEGRAQLASVSSDGAMSSG